MSALGLGLVAALAVILGIGIVGVLTREGDSNGSGSP